jgi:hypothetical protein
MSVQITTSMVKQFSANVFHLVQQKGSRLAPYVRRESISSEESFFDRIGTATARKKTSRHSDIVYDDTPHSRRRVISEDHYYADLVDSEDKLRIIINPESEYAIAARNALGRAMDDEIILQALGTAYTGKDGSGTASLGNSQKIAGHDGSGAAGVGLNVRTLRAVKKKFNENEAGDEDLYFCLSAEQLDDLLGETEVTSSDYAAVKALVHGDVDSFMGFKFIRSERLLALSATVAYDVNTGEVGSGGGTAPVGARRCFAWQKMGLLLATAKEITGRIDEIPRKHYAKQVYACMSLGATRMEEERVVEVICKE